MPYSSDMLPLSKTSRVRLTVSSRLALSVGAWVEVSGASAFSVAGVVSGVLEPQAVMDSIIATHNSRARILVVSCLRISVFSS